MTPIYFPSFCRWVEAAYADKDIKVRRRLSDLIRQEHKSPEAFELLRFAAFDNAEASARAGRAPETLDQNNKDLLKSFASNKGKFKKAAAFHFLFLCASRHDQRFKEYGDALNDLVKLSEQAQLSGHSLDECEFALEIDLNSKKYGGKTVAQEPDKPGATIQQAQHEELEPLSAVTPNLATLFSDERIDNDLHYSKHVVDVHGRQREQRVLHDFLGPGRNFYWLQLAGVGGQGKSRLAFDLVCEARKSGEWDAGFLTESGLIAFRDHWPNWRPTKNTLIVVDYVLGREREIAPAFQDLLRRSKEFEKSVRLLLVERQRWDRGGLERRQARGATGKPSVEFQPTEGGKAQWFLNICEKPSPDDADISPEDARITGTCFKDELICPTGVIELAPLEPDELVSLTREIAEERGHEISLSNHEIKTTLEHIDKSGRPLFAYLLAYSLADGRFDEGWGREDLLTHSLQREQNKRWKQAFGAEGRPCPDLDENSDSMRIARIATMIEGLENVTAANTLPEEDWPRLGKKRVLEEALVLVDGARGSGSHFAGYIPPMQPDILGEWFVLWAFASGVIDYQSMTRSAWKLAPHKTAVFLERCSQDFPSKLNRPETYRLLDVAPPDDDARKAYGSVCASLFANLYKAGIEDFPKEILKRLEIVATESKEPKAMTALGFCMLTGVAFEKNNDEGLRLTMAAAEAGNNSAMFNLGVCYENGTGVAADAKQAVMWYRKAAEAGNSDAMFNLGVCYDNGMGVAADAKQAVMWYRKAAEAGNSDAMFNLGVCYDNGMGVAADAKQAVMWYRKAAEAGNSDAMFNLGVCYDNGMGVAADAKQAVMWYRKAAEAGNSDAMFNLGVCYDNGMGVAADAKQAVMWYRKAAEAGNSDAMFNLGVCYDNGMGVAADAKQAVMWYRKAAEAGNSDAMFNLGVCYSNGTGVAADAKQAVMWYRKAAEAGNSSAMVNLGVCYENGTGVAADAKQAVMWYRKAAEAGNSDAMFNLGVCYDNGMGVAADAKQAVMWYRKAAEAGNSDAMFNLGVCYSNGTGVAADAKQAVMWYRKAAEAGNNNAMLNLGVCYSNGTGVVTDAKQAVKWYRKAAEAGNSRAMANLGVCYSNGTGVAIDAKQAVKWYRKAAEAGNSRAMANLGVCYSNGTGVAIDAKQAVKWYRKAAEAGNSRAMANLGVCYSNGTGVAIDAKQAVKWYRKAAEAGNSRAMANLGVCYLNGTGVATDAKQAVKWYRKAAEAGHEAAKTIIQSHPDRPGLPLDDLLLQKWAEKMGQPTWPMQPLLPGDWSKPKFRHRLALLRALTRFSHLRIKDGAIVQGLRSIPLSFYPNLQLSEALLEHDGELKIVCLLAGNDIELLLNGKSDVVHYLNALGHLSLIDPTVVGDYARFFCMAVCGRGGHFCIVDNVHSSMFYHELQRPILHDLSKKIIPFRLDKEAKVPFIFSATIKYADKLFSTYLKVLRGGRIKIVEPLDNTPIADNLPFYEEGFEGVFRFRRVPG
ncbi:tetratricopeptide repeat protein [Nitratireductor alexandrii]|uniref:tetratricopeptide repeat protein n=1 Tax=Nitratireductor alexandrii TaxID=2448161 RepID=UPI000FD7466C|nr:tetratricopeptide repeat protein [Nitratireductor alexandrii]